MDTSLCGGMDREKPVIGGAQVSSKDSDAMTQSHEITFQTIAQPLTGLLDLAFQKKYFVLCNYIEEADSNDHSA